MAPPRFQDELASLTENSEPNVWPWQGAADGTGPRRHYYKGGLGCFAEQVIL